MLITPSTVPTFTECVRWCQHVQARTTPPNYIEREIDAYMCRHLEEHFKQQRSQWFAAIKEERTRKSWIQKIIDICNT